MSFDTPIARTFIGALHRMNRELMLQTGCDGIHEIVISSELGLAMGIQPGMSAEVEGVAVSVVGGDLLTYRDVARTAFSGVVTGEGRIATVDDE